MPIGRLRNVTDLLLHGKVPTFQVLQHMFLFLRCKLILNDLKYSLKYEIEYQIFQNDANRTTQKCSWLSRRWKSSDVSGFSKISSLMKLCLPLCWSILHWIMFDILFDIILNIILNVKYSRMTPIGRPINASDWSPIEKFRCLGGFKECADWWNCV
jgi:hypothetical protein